MIEHNDESLTEKIMTKRLGDTAQKQHAKNTDNSASRRHTRDGSAPAAMCGDAGHEYQ